MKESDYKDIGIEVGVHDFKHTFGRMPTEEEFNKFADLCRKGVQAQLDWDIIFECTKDSMQV